MEEVSTFKKIIINLFSQNNNSFEDVDDLNHHTNKHLLLIEGNFDYYLKIKQTLLKSKVFKKFNFTNFPNLNSPEIREIIVSFATMFILKGLSKSSFKNTNAFFFSDDVINYVTGDIEKIFLWIKKDYEILLPNEIIIRSEITKCFFELIENKLITKEKIWYNQKTPIIYRPIYEITWDYLEIYLTNFKYVKISANYYIYSTSVFSLKNIFKKSIHNNSSFNWFDEESINNMCNNWFYIDKLLLEKFYILFCNENLINISNIEFSIKLLLEEYSYQLKNKNMVIISELSKRISITLYALKLKQILEFDLSDKKIYSSFFFDFRGRINYSSDISITNIIELRYCVHGGKYDKNLKKHHFFSDKITFILEKNHKYLSLINKFNLEFKNLETKNWIIWVLLSVSEIYKSQFGQKASIEQLIIKGIEMINNFEEEIENLKYKNKIKFILYYKILNEIGEGVEIKRFIAKDSTASCFQHLVKTLGPANDDSFKYCNMESEEFAYDTYKIIIDNFLNERSYEERIRKKFTRQALKRSIMTRYYSSTNKTCWNYFLEESDLRDLSENEKAELRKAFNGFYDYLGKNDILFKNHIDSIRDHFSKIKKTKFYDNAEINYEYFKHEKKEISYKTTSKINRKIYLILSNKVDNRKFNQSILANFNQSSDCCVPRWILKKNKIFTIHDSFLINYQDITYLIGILNECMQIRFHEFYYKGDYKVFSIFIAF